MEVQERIIQIDAEIESLLKIKEEKDKVWDYSKPIQEYWEYVRTENELAANLNREKRMIMPYVLSDLPDYGQVMTLRQFIGSVKSGGFIDYDGSGNYVKDGKMTNIDIYPSDVKHNSIRKEFTKIIWFNR
jgi:hypothetical protein